MNQDLEWLARNVTEWGSKIGLTFIIRSEGTHAYISNKSVDPDGLYRSKGHCVCRAFSRSEWQQAREDLGLICTPEEDEAWAEAEKRMDSIGQNGPTGDHYKGEVCAVCGCGFGGHFGTCSTLPGGDERIKQTRYQDATGEDWIDECARTFTPEEFRGAMRFTIGKYNRRMGKKDELVKEIEKIRDYATRWLEVEQRR